MKQLSILLITLSLFSPLYTMVTSGKSKASTQEPKKEPKKAEPKKAEAQEPESGSPLLRRYLDMITLCDEHSPRIYREKELVVVFESEKTIKAIAESERSLTDCSVIDINIDHLKDTPLAGAYFGRIIKIVSEVYSASSGMQCWYLVDLGKHNKFTNIPISSTLLRRLTSFRSPKPEDQFFIRQKGYGSITKE